MKRYSVTKNGVCLYICMMPSHIHVERFRVQPIDRYSSELNKIGYWYVYPPTSLSPYMTKMELVRMVQQISEETYNDVIKAIMLFSPVEQKGVESSTDSHSAKANSEP